MGVDAFDVVAIILGVLFTIRKLDAQRRTNKEFSHVAPHDFEDWQSREVSVFSTAMFVSFAKVFLDWGFVYFVADTIPFGTVRAVGATIDLSWLGVMLITFVRTQRLAKLRVKLRIVLGGFVVESEDGLSDELKEALRVLEQGELDRAQYLIQQVVLDADDSLRGVALYWLGECYLRQGKESEAHDSFVESLEVDPTLKQPQDALNRQMNEKES